MSKDDKIRRNAAPQDLVKPSSSKPGQIRFDDRGNAVYEWRDTSLTAEGKIADLRRVKALAPDGLSIMDEGSNLEVGDITNKRGLKVGYNPYKSGMLSGRATARKRDMRALSDWIQLKKRLTSSTK